MKIIPKGFSVIAVVSFALSLALCAFLAGTIIISKENIRKMEIEQHILEKSIQIHEIITSLLYKAHELAVIVVQGNGNVDDFEQIAPVIIEDAPAILNVFLAPDGIISKVYPPHGNESLLGLNLFEGGEKSIAAMAAKTAGGMVLGGPFNLVQGGQALAGRLPVYLKSVDNEQKFWGIVSVTLKFPQVMDEAGLNLLETYGYAYELWRINPDTHEKQIVMQSANHIHQESISIEKPIEIFHTFWYLKVSSTCKWYNYPSNLILCIAGLFISLFVFVVVQNNTELRQMKTFFEKMANIDSLTGLYNRRYLDENLQRIITTLSRSNSSLSLLMIDVDFFKNYNDAYGHSKGDTCLKIVAQILKNNLLRADDFVARYGGEEFVVVLPNTGEHGVRTIADRLLESTRNRGLLHEKSSVANYVTISIGATSALVQHTHAGNDYIKQADKAMYMSKQNGRNRYTYLNL